MSWPKLYFQFIFGHKCGLVCFFWSPSAIVLRQNSDQWYQPEEEPVAISICSENIKQHSIFQKYDSFNQKKKLTATNYQEKKIEMENE